MYLMQWLRAISKRGENVLWLPASAGLLFHDFCLNRSGKLARLKE